MFTRLRSWLRARLRRLWVRWWLALDPNAVIPVTPGDECLHDAEPAVLLHQLVSSVGEPERFAAVLASIAGCNACLLKTVCQFSYEIAGLISDQDESDSNELEQGCGHSVIPEIVSMRAILAQANGDPDGSVLGSTVFEVLRCPDCTLGVLLALLRFHVRLLDHEVPDWQPILSEHLLRTLDDAADRG